MSRTKKACAFFAMPALWIWRGCFDWRASWVAVRHGIAWLVLGRSATFRHTPRGTDGGA